jgi:uncharacterized protein
MMQKTIHFSRSRWVLPLVLVTLVSAISASLADLKVPSKPGLFFNDYAGVVDSASGKKMNEQLAQYERESSNQFLVVIFKSLNGADLEEFAARTYKAWGVGREKHNGAVLFIFVQDRKMRIEVGYGLEGALTDYLCGRIIEEKIKPRFKAGDFAGGIRSGIDAMMAAGRGEYQGTGSTLFEDEKRGILVDGDMFYILFIIVLVAFSFFSLLRRTRTYSSRGHSRGSGWSSSNSWSSGGWSSGGGSSGGSSSSGGFSGGGGSSGGGGASGSW